MCSFDNTMEFARARLEAIRPQSLKTSFSLKPPQEAEGAGVPLVRTFSFPISEAGNTATKQQQKIEASALCHPSCSVNSLTRQLLCANMLMLFAKLNLKNLCCCERLLRPFRSSPFLRIGYRLNNVRRFFFVVVVVAD